MKFLPLLILMITSVNGCYSQRFTGEIGSAIYMVGEKKVFTAQIVFPSSPVNRVFWIEDEIKTNWETQRLIRSYFYKRQGDFTLQEILDIDDMSGPILIGQSYFRICPSGEAVSLQFYSTDPTMDSTSWASRVEEWVHNHVVLIEESMVKKMVPNLRTITNLSTDELVIELPMFSPPQ